MNRLKAVELLIQRHKDKAAMLSQMADDHNKSAKDLECYRYELTKPGFRTVGWVRCTHGSRTEPYVVEGKIEGNGVWYEAVARKLRRK